MCYHARLFVLSLLMTALGVSATADTWKSGNLAYTYTAGSGEASVRLADQGGAYIVANASVTIPATVTIDGQTYKVTAIDDYGMTCLGDPEGYSSWNDWLPDSQQDKTVYYSYRKDHANFTLTSVTFEQPSNIRAIGKGAFQGCVALPSVVIPNSVETLGTEVMSECYNLRSVDFQTGDDDRVLIKVLPKNAFYQCPRLAALDLPEGIEEIADYAVQTCLSLKTIHLPNTLRHIGGHFLCDAKSLETLTIPASVDRIDGAFLHGCESLRTVYMLGPAATLADKYSDEDQSSSFGEFGGVNTAPASAQVNNCTFYVPRAYYDDYVASDVWRQLDSHNNTAGNDIRTPLPGGERTFGPGKWQTVIFYKPVRSYKSLLGEGCMVAELTGASVSDDDSDMYDLTFTLIDGTDIPAMKPYLIYCADTKAHMMFDESDEDTDQFKTFYTTAYTTSVAVDNEPGTTVQMTGMGQRMQLQKWQFYFKWNAAERQGSFWRVPDDNTRVMKTAFGCYWQVKRDGLKADARGLSQWALPTPAGIAGTAASNGSKVRVNIYDLNGRLVQRGTQAPGTQVPGKGLYIVGGKKVLAR